MDRLTLNQYQAVAKGFACYGQPIYPFFALGEEAGEVQGKVAKFIRKNKHLPDFDDVELKSALVKELGDVLWQVQACANELGVELEDIALKNLNKLYEHQQNNTIIGEGDER